VGLSRRPGHCHLSSGGQVNALLGKLAPRGRLAAAVAWRLLWAGDDRRRAIVWGNQRGFDRRPGPTEFVSVSEPRFVRSESRSIRLPRSSCMGVVALEDGPDSKTVMAEAGRFYGLDVFRASPDHAAIVIDCAVRERWPLLAVAMEGIEAMPKQWPTMLRAYVSRGGTLLLNGILPGSNRNLAAISEALEVDLPFGQTLDVPASEVVFSTEDRTFAGELAGVGFPPSPCESALADRSGAVNLVSVRSGRRLFPAVSEFVVGPGRVIVCAGTQAVARLAGALSPLEALKVLPALMLVRQVYGQAAWRAPTSFANFVIDDPALRTGKLGLDYRRALALAREHGFHLTVATIPRELGLADPEVVDLLRRNGRWLSACYHGNDHSGYEFYLPRAKDSRYRARPLSVQKAALRQAVARGESFAARTGLALDRVMVFPHGVGSPQIFSTLQSLGFLSACNFDDRYPLGASVPVDFDLGMRPADLAWDGFPLLWRRGLPDQMFRLDMFLGRPAITFGHVRALGADLDRFVQRADEIHRIGGDEVHWCSLEDISRHNYLQRHDPKLGWRVLMLSNEICLHNMDGVPRTYHIERTNSPAGYALHGDATREVAAGALNITIPAGGARTIRLAGPDSRLMSPGRPCSLQRVTAHQSSA
jgi:hypothetical protein